MRGAKVVSLLAGVAAAAVSGAAHAIAWYFQSPASRLVQDIDPLHRYVMWLIIVIFVGVFGFMFYACYAHRKSKGHKAEQFHQNTTVEILWTVIPAVILIVIAWPTTRVVVGQKNTSAPELTVKVTGYQCADVIHSWWMPAFGAKQDAIPGFIRDLHLREEKTGVYRSQCVELCGKEHGFMPIVVRVVSQPEYTKWVGAQKGWPNTAMQPFKQLSNAELAAVITFTRNSWGRK